MNEQWTADVVGEMHLHGVTGKQLAAAVGWHPKYLSQVLNGRVHPKGAEVKIRNALALLVSPSSMRCKHTTEAVPKI